VPDERADSLRLTLDVPDTARAGEVVNVTLRVANVTERRLDLYLTGREITFDLVVATARGDTVWRRLEGEVIPMMLRVESLQPQASLELAGTWPGLDQSGRTVPPGEYTIRGSLLAEGGALETAAYPLQLRPR
jgi:hypothetical protein